MLRLLLSLLLLAVVAQVAQAQDRMNFQGQLNNADGTPANGEFSVAFSLYIDSLGGAPLLTQTRRLRIVEGFFNTSLDVRTLRFDTLYWAGLAVEGGPELRPRLPLFSSPYSRSTRSLFGAENVVPSEGMPASARRGRGRRCTSSVTCSSKTSASCRRIRSCPSW